MTEATSTKELPPDWREVTVSDISVRVVVGYVGPGKKHYVREGIPFLMGKNVKSGRLDLHDLEMISERFHESLPKSSLEAGDVVVVRIGRSGEAAEIPSELGPANTSGLVIIKQPVFVIPQYLVRYLNSPEGLRASQAESRGATRMTLNTKKVAETRFPLAPCNEQRRIVTKLEACETRIDAAREALDDVPALLEQYRQSVLAAAFRGDLTRDWREANPDVEPASKLLERLRQERRQKWEEAELAKYEAKGKNPPKGWEKKYKIPATCESQLYRSENSIPEDWDVASIEEACHRVTVGHVGSMKNEYATEGIPFLRGQNVRENRFSEDGLLHVSLKFHEKLSKSRLLPGDVVVTRSGEVGTACVIPESVGEANCSDLVIIQRPIEILPEFIAMYVNSVGKKTINAGKVGVAITHFNTKSVAALPLPIPPLAEQERIVSAIRKLLSVTEAVERAQVDSLSELHSLTQSLLAKAFRGELVPQDPNDEPASELLARIREEREKKSPAKKARKAKA